MPLSHGRIVWVRVVDPQGRNPKTRPAVVISSNQDLDLGQDPVVVAITTQLDKAPEEHSVILPGGPGCRSGLSRKSAAVCIWVERIKPADIEREGGVLPVALMTEINAKVEQASGPT